MVAMYDNGLLEICCDADSALSALGGSYGFITQRITRNEEPDGASMEKRKPRLDRRGRVRRKAGGKMFRQLRLAKHWRIDARPDSVEISPKGSDKVATTHHFGKKGFVGRAPDGSKTSLPQAAQRRLATFRSSARSRLLQPSLPLLC